MTVQASETLVQLKDGREALIRPVRSGDGADLLAMTRLVHERGEGVVRTIEELPCSVEAQRRELEAWVSGPRSGPEGCMLVAQAESHVIGVGSIRRMARARMRHVGHIWLEVHPDWQGQGLGRVIMNGLIEWTRSDDGAGVVRIDLSVLADNVRAIQLYESMGFVREGVRQRLVRRDDGTEIDDVMMALIGKAIGSRQ